MNLKRKSLLVLILGFIIFIIGFTTPIIYWRNYTLQNGAISIIGGADTPTYNFMLRSLFDGLPFVLVCLGGGLVVSAGYCLLFSKTVKMYCSINATIISLGLSAVGALGLVCVFLWFSIVSFREISKHPIEYPIIIVIGILCFIAFAVLIVLYIKARKNNLSIKGFLIDILTSIIYLPTFFFVFLYLYEMIK